ncbi:hypothetical protein GOODEAATRI_033382, partial [Goodea atripinnis]
EPPQQHQQARLQAQIARVLTSFLQQPSSPPESHGKEADSSAGRRNTAGDSQRWISVRK